MWWHPITFTGRLNLSLSFKYFHAVNLKVGNWIIVDQQKVIKQWKVKSRMETGVVVITGIIGENRMASSKAL